MLPIRANNNGKVIVVQIMIFTWLISGVVLAQDGTATPEATASQTTTGIPTVTATSSPTVTPTWTDVPPTRTDLPTATSTESPTVTETPSNSSPPSDTPVFVSATPLPTVLPPTPIIVTQIVPVIQTSPPIIVTQIVAQQPPAPARVIPTTERTPQPSDLFGWVRSESIALVQVNGRWYLRQNNRASAGAFHEILQHGGILRLPFTGEGVRIGFIAHNQGGVFRILLDGEEIGVIDTFYSDDTELILQTYPIFVTGGYHVLDIVTILPVDNSRSIAIDYVDVFNGPPLPATATVLAPTQVQRVSLDNFELVSAPEMPEIISTTVEENPISLDVIVGYDVNANSQIEPNEGVRDLSIRVVDTRDNTLLASVFTDSAGFARIQTVISGDVVILIPLLGESLLLRQGSRQTSWVLRLDAVNVPGLIP